MEQLVKKFLNGLLDSDSSEKDVPPNCFVSGKNFRYGSTDKGGIGDFESILKNAEKFHVLPSGGINIRIGFATDDENGFIIKFNQNSIGDDGIYLFDIVNELWYTVLLSDDVTGGLNFNKYKLINGAYVINNILYWNDNENEPRKLHLGAFMAAYGQSPLPSPVDTDYTPTFPIDDSEITLIRRPSDYPPSIEKKYDSTFVANFIQNESYQFAIEFIHFDGERSVFSPWSMSSLLNKPDENFNYVYVVFNTTDDVPQTVRLVRIIVKNGKTGKGFVAKTWDRLITSENTDINNKNLTFNFYGNITGEPIDEATMVRPFHTVPLQSGSQERAKNRTILVNNLEGYDTPKSTSLLLALPTPISVGLSSLSKQLISIKHKQANPLVGTGLYAYSAWYVYLTEVVPVGYYEITSTAQTVTGSSVYPTLPAPPVTVAFGALTFRGNLTNVVIWNTRPGGSYYPGESEIVTTSNVSAVTGISTSTFSIFLPESHYKAGVVFYDRYLRKCGVVFTDDVIEIPARNYAFSAGYSSIFWSLSNSIVSDEIPDYAYYYSVVRTLNQNTRYFVASYTNQVRYATKNAVTGLLEFTATTFSSDVVAVAVNANALLQANLGWSVGEDDQCIIIDNSDNKYQLPLIGAEGDYFLLKPKDVGNVTSKTWVYRFYVPYKINEQEPYFEVGEMLAIDDPTLPSRNYSVISGYFRADSVVLMRTFNATSYFAEAMNPNDTYFQRWDTDAGRPNFPTKLGQVRHNTGISFSNVYIQGTQNNGLSEFDALNKEILPEDIGTATKAILTSKVQAEGSVLIVIGEQEACSVYLGEVQVFDAEGNPFLSKSSKFIGQINLLKGGFGSSNHESVVLCNNSMVAWYSLTKAKFVLYDNNGIYPISDNGLQRVSKLFSDKYAELTVGEIEALGSRPFVFGGFDPYHEEIYFCIPSTEETPPKGYLPSYVSPDLPIIYPYDIYDGIAKVLVYKSKLKRWGAPHEYQTEGFVDIRSLLYSSKSGSLYKHNVDDGTADTYSSWYGQSVIPSFGFLINEEANIVKEFLTLSVEGNFQPTFLNCYTTLPNIQTSDIVAEWKTRLGVFYVAIRRDRLSPNTTGTYDDKLNKGDKMQGQWLFVWAEFETNHLLQVRYFNCVYSRSSGQKT